MEVWGIVLLGLTVFFILRKKDKGDSKQSGLEAEVSRNTLPNYDEKTNKEKSSSPKLPEQPIKRQEKKALETKTIKLSSLICPESCTKCLMPPKELNMGGGPLKLSDLGLSTWGVPVEIGKEKFFITLDNETSTVKIANLESSRIIGEIPVDSKNSIIQYAYLFTQSSEDSTGYVLLVFNITKRNCMHSLLVKLTPEIAERIAEYPRFLPILLASPRVKIAGICIEDGQDVSILVRFLFNGVLGVLRVLPGKKRYPFFLEHLGNAKGKLLPKPLHLPYAELFLMESSVSYKTRSFGKAFELFYTKKKSSKRVVKNIVSFFVTEPKVPEFYYLLRVIRKYNALSLEELLPYLEKAVNQKREVKDTAFIHRLFAEYFYEKNEFGKAKEHARQAISLDEEVGIKRLLSKLEKQTQ